MARMTVDNTEFITEALNRGTKEMIRSVVMAGAKAAEGVMQDSMTAAGHVPGGWMKSRATGDMLQSVGHNEYREFYRGGQTDVYPQETDRKGIRNATKAYVINYGRGGVKRNGGHMGDKFITGKEKQTEEAVWQAMQAESDRIIENIDKE